MPPLLLQVKSPESSGEQFWGTVELIHCWINSTK